MKPVLEPPRRPDSPASSLALFERIERSFAWNWHFHPEIELTCILEGSGTRLVGDRSSPYGRHDLVLLGAGLPHNWMPGGKKARSKPDHAVVVQFLPSVMPTGLLSLPEFARIRNLMERATRGIHFPAATGKRFGEKLRNLLHEDSLVQWTGIIRILGELAGEPGSLLAGEGYRHRRSFKLSSRIDTVLRHIESNCREEIPLAEMAAMAGLTPGSFCRFFRRMTGKSYIAHRNQCRINHACVLLEEEDLPITEIAGTCGFNNLANFNRSFRGLLGMAPRDYRRLRSRQEGEVER
jgi:AraC-like DNA-binding protein